MSDAESLKQALANAVDKHYANPLKLEHLSENQVSELCNTHPKFIAFIQKEIDPSWKTNPQNLIFSGPGKPANADTSLSAPIEHEISEEERKRAEEIALLRHKHDIKMGELSGKLHHGQHSLHPLINDNTPEAALHSGSAASPTMPTVLAGNMYSSKRLHVGNLSPTTNERGLREEFERYGALRETLIITRADGSSRGYGFVEFLGARNAATALEARKGAIIGGRVISLSYATRTKGSNKRGRAESSDSSFSGKSTKKRR